MVHYVVVRSAGLVLFGVDAVAVRVGICDLDLVRKRPAVRAVLAGRDRMPRLCRCATTASSTGPSIWSPSRSYRVGRLCSLSGMDEGYGARIRPRGGSA